MDGVIARDGRRAENKRMEFQTGRNKQDFYLNSDQAKDQIGQLNRSKRKVFINNGPYSVIPSVPELFFRILKRNRTSNAALTRHRTSPSLLEEMWAFGIQNP